ncbi:probable arginine--tRNA ligase, mitochondrial [Bacillus rossius redtenbacheri]|uniref:probable arginine--tRNA ligase, mitochondrial n=1 Tax=Bacillus rossius redtenbacheri TaxID=93214 RepID=UPI002FDDA969
MMSSKLKAHLCLKILSVVKERLPANVAHTQLLPKISLGRMRHGKIVYFLPLSSLEPFSVEKTRNLLAADGIITDIRLEGPEHRENIALEINTEQFVKSVLEEELEKITNRSQVVHQAAAKEKIVIDYSSLNIAKPFHVGHLRSTIIGNFIANVLEFLGNDVVRINYLGDWGTQFGLLQAGMDLLGHSDDAVQQNPTRVLYEAYVAANQAAETDPGVGEKARRIFQALEEGTSADVEKWEMFRSCTVAELERTYRRLNVRFDVYEWESAYGASRIGDVLRALEEGGVMRAEADGRRVVDLGSRRVPLLKSDGTTLYLTRDVAAAVRRHSAHGFDRMLYVVDGSQRDHFAALAGVLARLGLPWSHALRHVAFGRVRGMSTRRGGVVFLADILDEARDLMRRRQRQSATTKIDLGDISDDTADVLGISAVIVSDLKQRRQRDYSFDWEKALQAQGGTGVRLQYAHCRLCSLERSCGVSLPPDCDPGALRESQAVSLVQELARFEEVVVRSSLELEACILVNYLFKLCSEINAALRVLPVKNQDGHTAAQRLLLFSAARQVLHRGMKIAGLQPLRQM